MRNNHGAAKQAAGDGFALHNAGNVPHPLLALFGAEETQFSMLVSRSTVPFTQDTLLLAVSHSGLA